MAMQCKIHILLKEEKTKRLVSFYEENRLEYHIILINFQKPYHRQSFYTFSPRTVKGVECIFVSQLK